MRSEEGGGSGSRSTLEKRAKVIAVTEALPTDQKERGWGGVGWGRVGGKGSNESGRERTGDERAEEWKEGRVEVEGKQELRLRG